MKKGADIVQKQYDLLKYMLGVLQKFPRDQRFLLGDRIQILLMDIQALLIEAYYSEKQQKKPILNKINIKLEQLRWFIRLCFERGYYNSKKMQYIQKQIDEIGKILGGWLKSLR